MEKDNVRQAYFESSNGFGLESGSVCTKKNWRNMSISGQPAPTVKERKYSLSTNVSSVKELAGKHTMLLWI